MRLLIIEDDREAASYLAKAFREAGHVPDLAHDGLDGYALAREGDYDAHDALLAIADGRLVSDDRRRKLTPRHGFKTRAEMATLFADLPDALNATVEIALRCAYRVRTRKPILPNFGVVAALDAAAPEVEAAPPLDEPAELRRQADQFVDLADLESLICRDPAGRSPREPRSHPQRGQAYTQRESFQDNGDLPEEV